MKFKHLPSFKMCFKEPSKYLQERKGESHMVLFEAKRIAVYILGSFLLAVSLNFFIINAYLYASRFSGASQLSSRVFHDFVGIEFSNGVLLFVLHIPVFIISLFKVGKAFTIYSILSVVFSTLFLEVLPVVSLS